MRVHHFGGAAEIADDAALDEVLELRYGAASADEYQLLPDEFPSLSILVRGELAAMYFWPYEGHPGWASQGSVVKTDVVFFIGGPDENATEIAAEVVVPFEEARRAAHEFLRLGTMPPSMEWLEL